MLIFLYYRPLKQHFLEENEWRNTIHFALKKKKERQAAYLRHSTSSTGTDLCFLSLLHGLVYRVKRY